MAYQIEKQTGDLIINGWEKGIAQSPHLGIANLQAVNISTETDEVMCSFARLKQISSSNITGTLTYYNSTTLTISYTSGSGLKAGQWIHIGAGITGLSAGNYYINAMSVGTRLTLVTPTGNSYVGTAVTGMSSGSASFYILNVIGIPVAYATENYHNTSNIAQTRYYILDDGGYVWVYDTKTANTSTSLSWFLPYNVGVSGFSGGYITSALNGGIAVLNGWLSIIVGNNIYWKPTSNLGAIPTSKYNNMLMSFYDTSNPHFAFVGSQNILYYTDGNYIGSIFPNTSTVNLLQNIQSYESWSISSQYTGLVTAQISGSVPNYGIDQTARVPAMFYAAEGGTLPTALKVDTIYYIQFPTASNVTSKEFYVYATQSLSDVNTLDVQTGASGSVFYFNTFNPIQTILDQFYLTGTLAMGATSAALSSNWAYPTGSYVIRFSDAETKTVTLTNGSASISWTGGLAAGVSAFISTSVGTSLFTFTPQRLSLPNFEIGQCIVEIGNNILIGCQGNVIYPWNQQDPKPSDLIFLPENNVVNMITVNNMGYILAGKKGNIYITNGSSAAAVISVPDFCAGISGTPSSYIEPYFTWGGLMYLRGRVYFSILDQTSAKDGNCGGIWSFVPTQNIFFGQDVGLALRLENQASYGTYSGYSRVLIPTQNQSAIAPQYWNAWQADASSSPYGIDFTSTVTSTVANIETDLIPTGTILNKKTFQQIEYKLSTPLAVGESVAISYRKNSTEAYTTCGTAVVESTTGLSGYFTANFENTQWLQLKAVLTPLSTSSSTFVRLKEIRIR